MASLRRKPRSPFWFACFTDADGARTQRSTKRSDRKKAQAVANEWERAAKLASEGRLGEAQARKVLSEIYEKTNGEVLVSSSTRDFLLRWPELKKEIVSHRTYVAYAQVARDFIASLGPRADRDISQINRTDVTKYRDQVALATSAVNANKLLKYLRVGLGVAWRDGLIQDNPAAKVDRLARREGEESERRPFTLAEVRSVLAVADGEWKGIILTGIYTGQRLADIASLRWVNVDLDAEVIKFISGKTTRRMEIPIAAPLLSFIEQMPSSDDPEAPLFPESYLVATNEKRDLSPLSQQFYDLLVKANLAEKRSKKVTGNGHAVRRKVNQLSFHSLRHTTTSMLKLAGVSEAVAMDIIGHDSKEMSRHYTHIDDKAKRKAVGKLIDLTGSV